jgi:hypothetical protein
MRKVVGTVVLTVMGLGLASTGALARGRQDPQQTRVEQRQARRDRIRARLEQRVQARMARVDRNHDGVISRDEWPGAAKRFDRIDRNGDGVVTADEVVKAMAARRLARRRR